MGKSKKRPLVFINFRGKDERQGLLPHLKQHLKDRNVNVFTDEDAFGEPVENLFKYIRRSRIVIVIFSVNYLESEWCLDELDEIRKCLETEKLDFAIPIFYKVKTSHVKKQSGKFGKRFVALQKKHRNSRVKRWKKALRYVAHSIGLTYEKRSSISELDFIKMIVERVDKILTKIASKDKDNYNNNNSPETSKGESSNLTDGHHLNKMLHSSTTLEAANLESRSYLQGFMVGSAWKDAIISPMESSSSSFRISHPANPLQFPINLQSFHSQRNEFLEKAINWLALHMMYEQTHPANIFSNWDKLDDYTMKNIIYSARKKTQMLMGYNGGVDSRPFLSTNFSPFVEVPISNRLLEPKAPQDYRRSIAYHNNINQYYPCSYVTGCRPMCANIRPTSDNCDILPISDDAESEDKTSCISFLSYYFRRCFSLSWGAKEDDEE